MTQGDGSAGPTSDAPSPGHSDAHASASAPGPGHSHSGAPAAPGHSHSHPHAPGHSHSHAHATPGADGHSHSHAHATPGADTKYLATALALIVAFMVAEVAVALTAHSLALFADAGHMLTDAGALGASLWAVRLAARPASGAMTYGFKRAEILSAALNGLVLAMVGAVILATAIGRLAHPLRVHGLALTVVAGVGVIVNLAATGVLAKANRQSLNIAGAFAHLLTDLWAFLGTLAAGIIIMTTGFERADPIASLVVVALMGRAAWGLLRASGRVLLEAAPEGVDLSEVRNHILALPSVTAVHDLHAWVVTSDLPAVSAHVVVKDGCFADGTAPQVLDQLQACLAGHFDVDHSTFQLEPASHLDHEGTQHD